MNYNEDVVFYTFEELAKILRLSITTLRNRHSQSPNTLPPSIVTPGSRRRLFPKPAVLEWLGVSNSNTDKVVTQSESSIRARGRPKNLEQRSKGERI